ncbi:hypothetical protein BASA81_000394 [Batrachochytrium salamandrivorans]|nr:hypothetical protein BASA81_000394 [Batrachochytrium salamandrivorans]
MTLALSTVAVCEAMGIDRKLGMDSGVLAGILNTSTARCWSSDSYGPCLASTRKFPASNNCNSGGGSQLMLKNLGLALEAALEAKVPILLATASQSHYQILCRYLDLARRTLVY